MKGVLRTQEEVEKIIALRLSGLSLSEVEKETGVPHATVHSIVQRWRRDCAIAGRQVAPRAAVRNGRPPPTQEQIARVIDLWRKGATRSEITADTGLKHGSISYYVGKWTEKNPEEAAKAQRGGRRHRLGMVSILVNGKVFETPEEAAEGREWTGEQLWKSLSNGMEVLGLDAIALADPELERARMFARGEDSVDERERHWASRG